MGRKGRGAWEQGYDVVFKVDQSFQLPKVVIYRSVHLALLQVDQVDQSGECKRLGEEKNTNIKEMQLLRIKDLLWSSCHHQTL